MQGTQRTGEDPVKRKRAPVPAGWLTGAKALICTMLAQAAPQAGRNGHRERAGRLRARDIRCGYGGVHAA